MLPSPNLKILSARDLGYGIGTREWAVAELQTALIISKTPRGTCSNVPLRSGVQTEPGLALFAAVPRKLGCGNARWGTRLKFAQDKRAAVSSGKRCGAIQLQKQSPTQGHKHP